ncbi:hypothetical protein ACJIZ3_017874 [Penstemon smallii]|uniref:HTH myb-type domain-containing protein n=1 Tax=Penstemon smallii TaxID=265156 RepID=A0ABD3SY39_9LAMI
MPLCQSLIPEDLAYAFKILPETPRTLLDVNRASQTTLSSLSFQPLSDDSDPTEEEGGSDPKRSRRTDDEAIENCEGKAVKKPRLVWTPQLHKRFVEVVQHLGLKNAVPKTIMQLMNVEGLTRENVASHLQKYRLYVTRMQGLSDEGPSPSDQLFSSAPLPPMQNFSENGNYNGSHVNMNSGGNGNYDGSHGNMNSAGGVQGYETGNENSLHHHHHHHYHHYHQQQYSNMMQQQKDWSGNKYKANTYSHHLTQNNN